jgi:hypothetical protein
VTDDRFAFLLAVLERATPRLRQLLGYEMWLGGVGMIGGLPRNAQRY